MTRPAYSLQAFAADLRRITAEDEDASVILSRVLPLAQQLALTDGWLEPEHYQTLPQQGFGVHLLHEEPDHTLAVFAVAWSPGRGAPPHNHGTWAVVVGVDGFEQNTLWRRTADGSRPGHAKLHEIESRLFGRGEAVSFLPDGIHSVQNTTERTTVSLHVYGKHLNYTGRSQFDLLTNVETPFVVMVD